jgi:hypothetical protein
MIIVVTPHAPQQGALHRAISLRYNKPVVDAITCITMHTKLAKAELQKETQPTHQLPFTKTTEIQTSTVYEL